MLQFVNQVSETRLTPEVKAKLKELVQKALQATDDGAAGSANAPASSSTSKTLGSFQASTQPDKPSVGPLVSITGRTE